MKLIFVKMLVTSMFGLGLFIGISTATGVSIPSAAAISGGLSYVSWRIENKNG